MVESICGQSSAYARKVEEELAKELVKTRVKRSHNKTRSESRQLISYTRELLYLFFYSRTL
jgi:hypothetical protein